MSKKKILLFSTLNPYPFWAGSETYWFDFVRDSRVYEQLDVSISLAESPATRTKADELKKLGHTVSFYKHFNVNFIRRNLYRLSDRVSRRETRTFPWYDRISSEPCDLVWFNVAAIADLNDLVYASRLCDKRSIPYVIILQGAREYYCPASEPELNRIREVAQRAARFVFVSKRNRRSLENGLTCVLDNAFISTNALSPARIDAAMRADSSSQVSNEGPARFICLGRFSGLDKGQNLLIEALSNESWCNRDWTVTFTGISEFGETYLRQMVRYFGIREDRFVYQAFTDDVYSAICNTDILVMPSLVEGMPYAMIEAMACGRPAIGTEVGGIPELIDERVTGWLSRTPDVDDLCDALERAWNDRVKWREMGAAAQARVMDERNETRSHADLLEELVSVVR